MAGKSVKLSNNNSRFKKTEEPGSDFEKRADQAVVDYETRKLKYLELGTKLVSIMQDKTLPDNKGPIATNIEREVIAELVKIASDINNDVEESEGMGSMAILTLLLKIALLQRDRINELAYKLQHLESTQNVSK